jgi:DNA-binding helix-hairpin-helix protein with protein kinase domain
MKYYFIDNNNNPVYIHLKSKELGSGGQATVYPVDTSKFSDHCVKIYHDSVKGEYDRIKYMVDHPPKKIIDSDLGFKICWPKAIVYDNYDKPVGYIMPLAYRGSSTLKILDSTHLHKTMREEFPDKKDWWKYERSEQKGMENRFKILNNISVAIYYIHEVKSYVLSDMKPENILATPDGKISIIDTDSFLIAEGDKVLFGTNYATEEYLAEESYSRIKQKLPLTIANDMFAFAVIAYKILVGCHPYVGRKRKPPYNKDSSIEYAIQNHLFVFGDRQQYLDLPPSGADYHKYFRSLPDKIQELFKRAFSSTDPYKRPNTDSWLRAIQDILGDVKQIKSNPKTVQSKSNRPTSVTIRDKSKIIKLLIGIGVAIIVATILFFTPAIIQSFGKKDFNSIVVQPETELIVGIYRLNVKIHGESTRQQYAEVIETDNNTFSIDVRSDFGRQSYVFLVLSDGTLISDELGKGIFSHDKITNDISLIFTSENNLIWEFIK